MNTTRNLAFRDESSSAPHELRHVADATTHPLDVAAQQLQEALEGEEVGRALAAQLATILRPHVLGRTSKFVLMWKEWGGTNEIDLRP